MPRLPLALLCVATAASAQVTSSFRNGASGYTGMSDVVLVDESGEPWDPTANYEGGNDFIDGAPNEQATLMRFDVSSIPIGALVSSTSLQLTLLDGTNTSYPLFALGVPWEVTQATWLRASTLIPWQVAGARGASDHDSTSGGTVVGTGAINVAFNTTGQNMVQAWVTAPAANFGFIIQNYAASDGTDVSHCDWPTAGQRPQLTVVTNLGTFVFRNGVAPSPGYAGCLDVAIGNGLDPVATNWDDSSAFEVDGQKTLLLSVELGAIPTWASVVSAALVVSPVTTSSSSYDAYELRRQWSETQATWLLASSAVPWEVGGAAGPADRSAVSLGSWVSPGVGNEALFFNAAGVAAVERWVRSPSTNFGFALQNPGAASAFRFRESEDTSTTSRPRFDVTWFEGQLVFGPVAGTTDRPAAVTIARTRLDGVAIGAGAPELVVLVTADSAGQVSVDGGGWAATAQVVIPAGMEEAGFYAQRSGPGLAALGADAGLAWKSAQIIVEYTDGGPGDAGALDAGFVEVDAGRASPLTLQVGCGCASGQSGSVGWLLFMGLGALAVLRLTRAGASPPSRR